MTVSPAEVSTVFSVSPELPEVYQVQVGKGVCVCVCVCVWCVYMCALGQRRVWDVGRGHSSGPGL